MKISRRQAIYTISAAAAVYASYKLIPHTAFAPSSSSKNPAELYNWHLQNFITQNSKLTPSETHYITQALALTEADGYQISHDIYYSGYSFSHKIDGSAVDSNRFAIGGYSQKSKIQELALPLLKEKNLNLEEWAPLQNLIGLGWDLEQEHFKVYWHFEDLSKIENAQLKTLLSSVDPQNYSSFGLASVTFKADQAIEHKVYMPLTTKAIAAEKNKYPFADEIIHINHMITNLRGVVPQLDLRGRAVTNALSGSAQQILSKYQELGLQVDTVTYENSTKHTLYFGG